jgi:D-alanyl-D-alanine carboxypeptidase (penicillin-binding protein 5/6)
LTYGFRYYDTVHLYAAGKSLKKVRVWEGEQDAIGVGLAKDAVVTIPRGSKKNLTASMDFGRVVKAPVKQGDQIGKLVVAMDGKNIYQSGLLAVSAVDEAGFVKRLWDAVVLFFVQLFGGDALAAS